MRRFICNFNVNPFCNVSELIDSFVYKILYWFSSSGTERISPCNLKKKVQVDQRKVVILFYKTITLWFLCLDGLIQARGKVSRVKKSTYYLLPLYYLFIQLASELHH